MEPVSPKKSSWPWLMASVAAVALGLLLSIPKFTEQERRNPPIASVKTDVPISRNLTPEERLNHSLLADSVLSIVQSYYVDGERVQNSRLVKAMLGAFAEHTTGHARLHDGKVVIKYRGMRKVIPYDRGGSYQAILDVYIAIAALVDAYDITVTDVDGTSTSSPGSVKLLNHVLASLDAHSALLSPDAYRELRQGTEGSFGGLGVLVGIRENLLTVIKPLPRSPAKRAGIRRHDRILGIDGVRTYGYGLDDLVEYMRGDPGTVVKLSLLREGEISPAEMELRREIIHVDSVTTKDIIKGSSYILHLTIESFSSRTSREVLSAIKRFRRRHGGRLDGLVLDMRSNPGGLLDQAVQVVDLFIPEGVIVSTKGRREEVESAGSGFDEIGFPMVTLIDGDSASASEIVAGALQDHGRSVIVGQPSFGKGSVQTIFELPGERALKLTIARYYTPAGRSIQNVGIVPDFWLQPVLRGTENDNKLGRYRYKNERFLRNHLVSDGPQETLGNSAMKSYYLTSERDPDEDRDPKKDVELSAALSIIRTVNKQYPRMSKAGARASHWLALSGPVLKNKFGQLETKVADYLHEKHGIDWVGANTGRPAPVVKLGKALYNTVPGGGVSIPWTIDNPHSSDLHRVSVYVRSEAVGFETKEILVGDIPAEASVSGALKLTTPTFWTEGLKHVRLGIAIDAWPSEAGADLKLDVRHRDMATLTTKTNLINEIGGHLSGRLEMKEKAELEVELKNTGMADASNLLVKLINLSGTQIDVGQDSVTIERLEKGKTTKVRFPINSKAELYSDRLGIGLHVESKDLGVPYAQRIAIDASPTAQIGKGPNAVGH